MLTGRRIGILAASAVMLLAGPVVGQEIAGQEAIAPEKHPMAVCPAVHEGVASGFAPTAPPTRCSEPTMPPAFVMPFRSEASTSSEATAAAPLAADLHLVSTELGFDKGVAPAPGHSVQYRGQKYRVTGIEVKGGGRFFSGGSAFVIGVSGSSLIVGLKAIQPGSALDPDRFDPSVVN
ncbi:MAG: hypothetical protein JSR90_17650 [Proteobacteria bacterium]|nr:hypothetical protein [Pseudomonadota bacterium]